MDCQSLRRYDWRWFAAPNCNAALQALSDQQVRRGANAVNALVIDRDAVASQEHMQKPVAKAPALWQIVEDVA